MMTDINKIGSADELLHKEDELAAAAVPEPGERTIETITAEILMIKRVSVRFALSVAIEFGRRLTEAKEKMPYGEWCAWVRDGAKFSRVTASRYIKIFENYGPLLERLLAEGKDVSTLKHLSVSNALALLAVPAEERESFAAEHHVDELSTREMNELMDRLKASEEARAKAEDELTVRTTERDVLALQVKELESRPVEVAVKEPDPEEIQRRVDAAVAEATKELKTESKNLRSQLKEAKAKAERLAKEAEDSKKTAADAEKIAGERDQLREKIGELEKRLAVSDAAVAAFNVHFENVQLEFGKMAAGLRDIGNEETREKVRSAVLRLLDKFREDLAG